VISPAEGARCVCRNSNATIISKVCQRYFFNIIIVGNRVQMQFNVPSVDREIRKEEDFPYIILRLSFVIAGSLDSGEEDFPYIILRLSFVIAGSLDSGNDK
ncbi:MAG: hypothetical protein L0220_20875, partial [Acidobacteria bacterium]|nr:hypothetical protein [Acidobacteriota bacterium]